MLNLILDFFPEGKDFPKKHLRIEAQLVAPHNKVTACKGFTKYLIDEDFVVRMHSYLNGMLNRWRSSAIDILNLAEHSNRFNQMHIETQRNWIQVHVLRAMVGIAALKSFPVHILSKKSIHALIKGVDSEEMADLIQNIANCTTFSMIAFPRKRNRRFDVVTRFDNDSSTSKVYGTKNTSVLSTQ